MNITIEQLKSMGFYQKNPEFFDSIINSNKSLVNMGNGFLLYLYTLNEEPYGEHKEFEYYPQKLSRIKQSIDAISKINLGSRLNNAYSQLALHTEKLLLKDTISTTDLNRYSSMICEQEDALFENDFLEILNKLKNEISDLRRNLPNKKLPTIIETYLVCKHNKSNLHERKTVPFEMKRPPMTNSLVLPTEPNPEFTLIWTGYSVGPMMGHGTEEIWKVIKEEWQCQASKRTWVS